MDMAVDAAANAAVLGANQYLVTLRAKVVCLMRFWLMRRYLDYTDAPLGFVGVGHFAAFAVIDKYNFISS
jgi:hypothetical protein